MVARRRKPKSVAGVPKPSSIIGKPAKTKTKAIRSNAISVFKLAKQVKALQMSQYGAKQSNIQNLVVDYLTPTASAPLLFDTTDFTCYRSALNNQGCQVYQEDAVGTVPGASGFNIQDWFGNPFWERQNQDVIDTGKYLPLYVKYTIRIEGQRSLDNTRVRFDLFSAKSKAIVPSQGGAPSGNVVMPSALVHMHDMANPTKNKLNPFYFTKYGSKTYFINSTKTDPNTKGTTGNIFYHTFVVRPKKPRMQAMTNPFNPELGNPEVPDGNYGPLNVSVDQPLWCMISTDDESAIGDRVQINISRHCVWRDGQGAAPLYGGVTTV